MFPKCFILEAEKELAASCFVLHSKQNKASFLELLTSFGRLNRGSYMAVAPLSKGILSSFLNVPSCHSHYCLWLTNCLGNKVRKQEWCMAKNENPSFFKLQ